MSKNEYLVPGEIAVALSTGRAEMMAPLIRTVESGHRVLTKEEIHGVLQLLRDQIKYRGEDAVRIARMEQTLHIVDDAAKSMRAVHERLQTGLKALGSNQPLEPEA